MADKKPEMYAKVARLQTFEKAHQGSKRRASSQTSSKKKTGGNTVEWPHQQPAPEDLARAGFYYHPTAESPDNVRCFHCDVKLDGWEPSDNPLEEHLAHARNCQWAQSVFAGVAVRQLGLDKAPNPMGDVLFEARKSTFDADPGWPHENKRGWKCKIAKMVEAGWCLDPSPRSEVEDSDGVTCFYCDLSLDGWEPKDDPAAEHLRRSPECAFFKLVEQYGSATTTGKKGKAKGKGKGAARSSTASKASRISTQSMASEAPSLAEFDTAEEILTLDDSIVSTASQATVTGPTAGKKGGRAKAAAKGAKGRKRAGTVDSQADATPLYPDLSSQADPPSQPAIKADPAPAPIRKTRKGVRQSKQPLDSSVIEISAVDIAPPPKKATRGRKAKPQPEPEPESIELDNTEVSAQLQEELERSMDMGMEIDALPAAIVPAESKRGVKRTSDGARKEQNVDTEAVSVDDFPIPPSISPVVKAKTARKVSKQAASRTSALQHEAQNDVSIADSDAEVAKPTKGKKASAKKGIRSKKASSTRSSRSSKATVTAETESTQDLPEDLDRDEREIEAELQRIADEQAMQAEQDRAAEFEPSPSQTQKHAHALQQLEKEVEAEASRKSMSMPTVTAAAFSQETSTAAPSTQTATPSPSGSDKENHPSTSARSAKPAPITAPILSPTKPTTTRIPLAPGTPNRLSPSKPRTLHLSPSKQFSRLTSTQPWEPVDLDFILAVSPQPTPGGLAQRLKDAGVAGALTSPEKALTLEEWVRFRADLGEKELRRRCEELVGVFEREGLRGLACLEGLNVVGGQ